MPSLRERQSSFALALVASGALADARIAIYRNAVLANYRSALGATYPVVAQIVGTPFFNAAVDAYVLAHAATSGDLNLYGDRFGDFLGTYPHAQDLPYLPDVARLEWAIDDASRAADSTGAPETILHDLAAISPTAITAQRFALASSCRIIASPYPVLRIWQAHQTGFVNDAAIAFGGAGDYLLVRREQGAVVVQRLAAGDCAWLEALSRGADLATAQSAAVAAEPTFDLGTALRRHIAERTIARLRRSVIPD
jgi:hypothetical protein